jgi:hypothetical protein
LNRTMQSIVFVLPLLTISVPAQSTQADSKPPADRAALSQEIAALDKAFFDVVNRCDLAKVAPYVDDKLEFYHDKAGLMVGKQAFLDALKNNTCNVMIRELVPESLEVFPIAGYGAIELGTHRFHHPGHEKSWPGAEQVGMTRFLDPGAPEWPVGEAKFLHVWRYDHGTWILTRVISYDH